MNFKKIIASAVLSASLFTFGAADCIVNTTSVAQASSREDRLIEAIIVDAIVEAERDRRAAERYDRYDYYDGYNDGYRHGHRNGYYDDYDYYYGY